jgi:hypothetical protein
MAFSRRSLRRIGPLLAVMLLFAQMVTVAYGCPYAPLQETRASSAAMHDCGGDMDDAQPNLQAHCEAFAQAPAKPISFDVPVAPAATVQSVLVLAFATLDVPDLDTTQVVRPPGAPPIYLVHSNFRN